MIKEKMGSNGVASVWGRRKERERGCGVSAVMREGINCLFVSIFIRKSRVIGQRLKRFSYIFFLGRNNFAKNMNSNVEP